jgi:hypothetical protein
MTGGFSDWTIITTSNNHKQLTGLFPGTTYEWRVRSICNLQGVTTSAWSVKQTFTTATSLQANGKSLPGRENTIDAVYPNPVAQSATVSFTLSKASPVKISLLDMQNKFLKVIANGDFTAGNHKINFSRGSLSAGTYIVQVKTGEGILTKKIILE